MATHAAIVPTEEKTNGFRLLSLVIDGGTLVLRHRFDKAIPPHDLQNKLGDSQTRKKLQQLQNNGKISADHWRLLYPPVGQPDSSTFDVSLLTCLLRSICGLNEHSQAWKGIPSSRDTSIEADVQKLRLCRNKMCHLKSISLSDQVFQQKWDETEQVILRLGKDITTLGNEIQNLQSSSIDPKKEKYYLEKLKECAEVDDIRKQITKVGIDVEKIAKQLEGTEMKTLDLERKHEKLEKGFQEEQRQISERLKDLTEKTESDRKLPPELENLCSMTKLFLEDEDRDQVYVETASHIKAKDTLKKTHCLILTGLPGEGKTTMATKIISEVKKSNSVLKLREPSDWKYIDLSKPDFDMIFIDDIFGAGSFDETLHKGWSKYLPEIEKAVKAQKLYVVITTRHYILEEAREKMRRMQLFIDDNVVVLDSTKLTQSERTQLLRKHLNHADMEYDQGFIDKCDFTYETTFSDIRNDYMSLRDTDISSYIWRVKRIGFPEIVNIFASTKQLYEQGPSFFEKPFAFFKKCMEDLFLDEEKYLALILIWSRPSKKLHEKDIVSSSVSADIKATINTFNFELKGSLFNILRRSLKYHKGGFLKFDSKFGTYTFCHNIVKDMVGLVAGQGYPEAVLQFADKEFIMQYITTDKEKDDGYHLYIEEYNFEKLLQVICNRLLFDIERGFNYNYNYTLRSLNIIMEHLKYSCLVHDAFCNKAFASLFYQSVEGKKVLSEPVATLSKHFTSYGLCLPEETPIYFPTLALLFKNSTLLEVFLQNEFCPASETSSQFLEMSLLFAVDAGLQSSVFLLLANGAMVTEKSLLVASYNNFTSILNILLESRKPNYKACYQDIKHQSSPLIEAATKGKSALVKCLIKHGVDVNYLNDKKVSALSKAAIHGEVETCRILLETGASVNVREGKYKRTPLHIVADLDRKRIKEELVEIAQLLMKHGALLFIKDYRGHYPIHCAAIRRHNDVVETLLNEDISQASVKITSHGDKSIIKGMNLFHIAVWKRNPKLIDILLQKNIDPNVQDSYGRTPFYCSVYENKADICKKLFDVADKAKVNRTGFTPLHAAIRNGNVELVRMICPHAEINARDKYGKAPIHTACETKDIEIFRLLVVEYRADVRMCTNKGQTIFDILQSRKGFSQHTKSAKKEEKSVSVEDKLDQFKLIVASVDNEFANNWEHLHRSSRVPKE